MSNLLISWHTSYDTSTNLEASDAEVNNIVSLSWEFLSLEHLTIALRTERRNCEQ